MRYAMQAQSAQLIFSPRPRSSGDRASASGAEGRRFESCRGHPFHQRKYPKSGPPTTSLPLRCSPAPARFGSQRRPQAGSRNPFPHAAERSRRPSPWSQYQAEHARNQHAQRPGGRLAGSQLASFRHWWPRYREVLPQAKEIPSVRTLPALSMAQLQELIWLFTPNPVPPILNEVRAANDFVFELEEDGVDPPKML